MRLTALTIDGIIKFINTLERRLRIVEASTGGSGTTDHGSLGGLADDDHTQYYNATRGDARYAVLAKGVTNGDSHNHFGGDGAQVDHGGLSGLSDDDHSIYHNDTRGDVRYLKLQGAAAQTINAAGSSDANLIIESVSNPYLFFLDAGANGIGINNPAPAKSLDLIGNFRIVSDTTSGHGFDLSTLGVTNTWGYGRNVLYLRPALADVDYPGVQVAIKNYDSTSTYRAASLSFRDGDDTEMFSFGVTAASVFLDTPTASTSVIFRLGTGFAQRFIITTDGHVTPGANKTQNLGAADKRWNTLYQGTSTAAGTSRTFSSKRSCPVCKTKMIRGSGSLCILGEDRDYEVAMCPSCGILATEEIQHLPKEKLSRRAKPPKIEFLGFEVFEMSGNSRKVRVDFEYQAEVSEGEGSQKKIIAPAIRNSTYLGEEELAQFVLMNDSQQEKFLLALGQREWDALEEIHLMKEEVSILQSTLETLAIGKKGKNLAKASKS